MIFVNFIRGHKYVSGVVDELVNLLGIDYTDVELEVWQERAINGPYKTSGDVSTNSPGDWDRIISSANSLLSNPIADNWTAPTTYRSGAGGSPPIVPLVTPHIPQWAYPDPTTQGVKVMNAAFAYMVAGNTSYRDAAKTAILAQLNDISLDFSNTVLWKRGVLYDVNPGFIIPEWAHRYFMAYNYIKSSFSESQQNALDVWFENIALFLQFDLDKPFVDFFVERGEVPYVFKVASNNTSKAVSSGYFTYDGGDNVKILHEYYNNRRLTAAKYLAYLGVYRENESLINSAKLYYKELIKFGCFSNGLLADMYRGDSSTLKEQGVAYTASMAMIMWDMASMFAKNGDFDLLYYYTSDGKFGTEGGPKSLQLILDKIFSIYNKTLELYMDGERLDGEYAPQNWKSIYDMNLAAANIFYKNNTWKQTYLRTHAGSNPIPANPAGAGAVNGYMGTGGASPGRAFMFAQLEDVIFPYNL
jgi:hypothetical protein